MKKSHAHLILIFVMFFCTACGSLRFTARGCRSEGVWGERVLGEEHLSEVSVSETYYVGIDDREVRLKDLLKEKNLKCEDIKKMRIEMSSQFFIKRNLKIVLLK